MLSKILYGLIVIFVTIYKKFEKEMIQITVPGFKWLVSKRFAENGVRINGPGPIDIQVRKEHETEFFVRVSNGPSLGLGEMFMEGKWTCKSLDGLMEQIFKAEIYQFYLNPINRTVNFFLFDVCNLQTKERAWEVAQQHYDKGNQLFESFLDPTMNYSCGYWQNGAKTLEESQINKMNLIGRKLKLKPGMRVLDIGCGWGGLCKYLAQNYNVEVTGCTISKEQAESARQTCQNLPVDIQLIDYRDITEKFDRIVSVGMFEHVGTHNYDTFFKVVSKCLTPDGIFLLHTIGLNDPRVPRIEPWFHKYIFPNGVLPLHTDITTHARGRLVLEDWHNFGNDYSKTLTAWRNNFVKNWPTINFRYDDVFFRMWYFYLSLCIGAFRSRKYQLWQVVLSKNGVQGGYESVR